MQSRLKTLQLFRSSCVASLAVSLHLVFSGTLAGAAPENNAPTASPQRPNILLILVDDMGFSDVSPYGGEIYTPNIANLASQGAMFTNFHVAPTCTPTRAMLMTGRDNHDVGVGNMRELLADNQYGKPGYEGALN